MDILLEQLVYGSFPFWDRGYDVLARSPGCRAEWVADVLAACRQFGEAPAGRDARRRPCSRSGCRAAPGRSWGSGRKGSTTGDGPGPWRSTPCWSPLATTAGPAPTPSPSPGPSAATGRPGPTLDALFWTVESPSPGPPDRPAGPADRRGADAGPAGRAGIGRADRRARPRGLAGLARSRPGDGPRWRPGRSATPTGSTSSPSPGWRGSSSTGPTSTRPRSTPGPGPGRRRRLPPYSGGPGRRGPGGPRRGGPGLASLGDLGTRGLGRTRLDAARSSPTRRSSPRTRARIVAGLEDLADRFEVGGSNDPGELMAPDRGPGPLSGADPLARRARPARRRGRPRPRPGPGLARADQPDLRRRPPLARRLRRRSRSPASSTGSPGRSTSTPRPGPRPSPGALAEALSREGPIRPTPLAARYPALSDYARFLGKLPRRRSSP